MKNKIELDSYEKFLFDKYKIDKIEKISHKTEKKYGKMYDIFDIEYKSGFPLYKKIKFKRGINDVYDDSHGFEKDFLNYTTIYTPSEQAKIHYKLFSKLKLLKN